MEQDILKFTPKYEEHIFLAKIRQKRGKYDEAINEVNEALNICKSEEAYRLLWEVLTDSRRYDEAINSIANIACDSYPSLYVCLGKSFQTKGNFTLATTYFEKAKSLGCLEAYYKLGYLFSFRAYPCYNPPLAIDIYLDLLKQKDLTDRGNVYCKIAHIYESINSDKCIDYYELGANENNEECLLKMVSLLEDKKFDKLKTYKVLELLRKHPMKSADFAIGVMFRKGKDVPQNLQIAYEYFLSASFQRSVLADFELALIELLDPNTIDFAKGGFRSCFTREFQLVKTYFENCCNNKEISEANIRIIKKICNKCEKEIKNGIVIN